MTVPYAEVIGDPVAHSKSPAIHGFWLERLGIGAEYRAQLVRPGAIPDYLDLRRGDEAWRGCNVTIPHKESILHLLDAVEPGADRIGAVNTVVRQAGGRLLGTNTDIDGIAEAIGQHDLQGRRVVVIGCGGAARAAFVYLSKQGCARVSILARNAEKAKRAAQECRLKAVPLAFQPRSGAFQEAALVINATQLGMDGQDEMPQFVLDEVKTAATDALVFDMVYVPLDTKLLSAAKSRGFATADGLAMLVGQASFAFERFFGRRPPRDCDDELRAMLAP